MKLIENYIEFDGSHVQIWKLGKDKYSKIYKERLWWRYYFEINGGSNSGGGITLRHAKNDALAILLDKEWENLPRSMRERNERRLKNSE